MTVKHQVQYDFNMWLCLYFSLSHTVCVGLHEKERMCAMQTDNSHNICFDLKIEILFDDNRHNSR